MDCFLFVMSEFENEEMGKCHHEAGRDEKISQGAKYLLNC